MKLWHKNKVYRLNNVLLLDLGHQVGIGFPNKNGRRDAVRFNVPVEIIDEISKRAEVVG